MKQTKFKKTKKDVLPHEKALKAVEAEIKSLTTQLATETNAINISAFQQKLKTFQKSKLQLENKIKQVTLDNSEMANDMAQNTSSNKIIAFTSAFNLPVHLTGNAMPESGNVPSSVSGEASFTDNDVVCTEPNSEQATPASSTPNSLPSPSLPNTPNVGLTSSINRFLASKSTPPSAPTIVPALKVTTVTLPVTTSIVSTPNDRQFDDEDDRSALDVLKQHYGEHDVENLQTTLDQKSKFF